MRRILLVPAALMFATVAGAQKPAAAATRTPPATGHAPAPTLPRGAAAAWNGVPSKWGGSPPARAEDRDHRFVGRPGAYIPVAVAAPYPVAAPIDTVYAPAPEAAVQRPVVAAAHEERQLTTIEVYRLQPRFQHP